MTTLSREEIYEKAGQLREFGVYNEPLTQRWQRVEEERWLQDTPICAVAGLNNMDTDGALLELLRQNPQDVMAGLELAAIAVNAEGKVLVLPEEEKALGESLAELAARYGVELEYGMVNARQYRGSAVHHIETMIALAQTVEGRYQPGTWVAVRKGGQTSPLRRVEYGATVADVLGEDAQGLRAFALGRALYAAGSLGMAIQPDTNLGNGVITLYPDSCCIIHEAEQVLLDERQRSCGKCTFCREGLIQLHTMTKEITQGKGKGEYLDMMGEIGQAMVFSTPCSVGQTGSRFTLDAMSLFAEEYEDHIKRRKCKNNVCSAFTSIYIDPSLCQGCEDCVDVCPEDCIEGKAGYIHMIDDFDCTKCGKCIDACDYDAIVRSSGRVPKLPSRLTKCGKFR